MTGDKSCEKRLQFPFIPTAIPPRNDLSVDPSVNLRLQRSAGRPFAFHLASPFRAHGSLTCRIGRFANRTNHARTNSANDRKIVVRVLLRGPNLFYMSMHFDDVDAMVSPPRIGKT